MLAKHVLEILGFWFPAGRAITGETMKRWFSSGPEIDALIKQNFETLLLSVTKDDFNSPQEALALTILMDQFPRNIYRNTPKMFAWDGRALEVAKRAISSGADHDASLIKEYGPLARAFFYLPFEHSECLADQVNSLELFEKLHAEVADQMSAGFLDYAKQHWSIVERFGRFPHRNAVFGRESRPEEVAFLESGGQTFGVKKDL